MSGGRALGGLGIVLGLALLAGCATSPDWHAARPAPPLAERVCLTLLASLDAAVTEAGVADGAAARIEGFPYLRVDRFLASFRHELTTSEAFADWVARLRRRDAQARRVEVANLPVAPRRALTRRFGVPALAPAANACGERLVHHELLTAGGPARRALVRAVKAPDHYLTWRRVVGLYPLTRLGLALGYQQWKQEQLTPFARPLATMAASTSRVRHYVPVSAEDDEQRGEGGEGDTVAALVRGAPRSPLGIPELDAAALQRLAARHAPVYRIETHSVADRPGTPYWRDGPRGPLPAVDTTRPAVDVRLVHTRFQGAVLPQLVYTLWFPARPRQGPLDLLGGRLDGLVWRVTLGEDGTPLIYDSIHPCGCYHLFFPVSPLERVEVPADHDLREAPLTPRPAPRLAPGERLHLHLAATSHYLENLGAGPSRVTGARAYTLVPVSHPPRYGQRSLALPGGGRRSLFDPRGLVPGTERLERFLLWPAGILSPGAMRQWGTHATVFVGRRHFDDPFLFEAAFALPDRGP
ncbi:hypothetical protein [Halomonas cerina]|uniref:Uncharacterized protein n=1 Tax=Halomonas cerina TaxID=447424 RepID=A0A839VAT7_9GAMM|nr:hypothetical protein [Halomonas cerina]MBB3190539.1 hypothetical protein [Halomonas cerina]